MHYASYGLIGYTMKIIRGATRIASSHPRREVTLATLSQSFAVKVWAERLDVPHPFEESFELDKAARLLIPSETPAIPTRLGKHKALRPEWHA